MVRFSRFLLLLLKQTQLCLLSLCFTQLCCDLGAALKSLVHSISTLPCPMESSAQQENSECFRKGEGNCCLISVQECSAFTPAQSHRNDKMSYRYIHQKSELHSDGVSYWTKHTYSSMEMGPFLKPDVNGIQNLYGKMNYHLKVKGMLCVND